MHEGRNQYAPMAGVPQLREAIAAKVRTLYGAAYDPEHEITVTPGATYAIFNAIATLIRPGDEVIVFEPTYDSYVPSIEVQGGMPVYVGLKFPDYHIDWDEVRTRDHAENAHDPDQHAQQPDRERVLRRRHAGARQHHAQHRHRDHQRRSLRAHRVRRRAASERRRAFPGLAERSFVVSSFGKTYHVTGWKMGYCLAPRELMNEFRKVHQFNVFVCNSPVQYALADFMQREEHYLGLAAFYQKKRDYFRDRLRESRFTLLPSDGTFFQSVRYDDISDEKDTDFAVRLTREHGIAAIPLSAFYREPPPQKVLRFCFAKKEETLAKGTAILRRI